MNTKKALAGLLGLLGSFAAFPFLVVAFPAFVEALPFLFTESLPPYRRSREKQSYKYILRERQRFVWCNFQIWDLSDLHQRVFKSKWIKQRTDSLRKLMKKQNLLGVSSLRLGLWFPSFHVESCKHTIWSAKINLNTRKFDENWPETTVLTSLRSETRVRVSLELGFERGEREKDRDKWDWLIDSKRGGGPWDAERRRY